MHTHTYNTHEKNIKKNLDVHQQMANMHVAETEHKNKNQSTEEEDDIDDEHGKKNSSDFIHVVRPW